MVNGKEWNATAGLGPPDAPRRFPEFGNDLDSKFGVTFPASLAGCRSLVATALLAPPQ